MKIRSILKPSKKKVAGLIVLIILAVIGFNFFSPKKQAPLQFATVKKQDIKSVVSSSGSLTGKSVANLKFKSAGKLSYVNVKAGDWVKKYQSIAGLDTQDLAITLQQATNSLRDKQAIVDKALDDVKDHSKDESFAQRVTRTAAEVTRDNAFDSVKAAQRAFQDVEISSPIDGVVTQALIVSGQTVSGSDLIAQVVDISSIYFDTDVDEADISKISVGQTSEITLDAYGEKIFKGVVEQIIPQTKTTSSGATVVTVRIKLDQFPGNFINGLSGQSEIIISRAENVLIIPLEALGEDNMVILQNEKGQQKVKVLPGIQSDTDVEIKMGLQEGDKIWLNYPK